MYTPTTVHCLKYSIHYNRIIVQVGASKEYICRVKTRLRLKIENQVLFVCKQQQCIVTIKRDIDRAIIINNTSLYLAVS